MSFLESIKTCLAKKTFLLIILVFSLFVSCDYFYYFKLKNTVTDYIKQTSTNADVEVTKVINDTIPFYFDSTLQQDVGLFYAIFYKWVDKGLKKENYELFTQQIMEAKRNVMRSFNKAEKKKGYIVYTKIIPKEYGTDSVSKQIFIFDKNNTDTFTQHITFDDSYNEYISHLLFALTVPIELDENDCLDFSAVEKWYRHSISELEIGSDKVYAKHEKYFK